MKGDSGHPGAAGDKGDKVSLFLSETHLTTHQHCYTRFFFCIITSCTYLHLIKIKPELLLYNQPSFLAPFPEERASLDVF